MLQCFICYRTIKQWYNIRLCTINNIIIPILANMHRNWEQNVFSHWNINTGNTRSTFQSIHSQITPKLIIKRINSYVTSSFTNNSVQNTECIYKILHYECIWNLLSIIILLIARWLMKKWQMRTTDKILQNSSIRSLTNQLQNCNK